MKAQPPAADSAKCELPEVDVKLARLRTAIDEGDASGIADGDSFNRAREELSLLSRLTSPRHS